MHLVRNVRQWLPQGGTLPRAVLVTRHRGILVLLWAHVPVLLLLAWLAGETAAHGVAQTVPVVACAVAASYGRPEAPSRRVLATLGLLVSSAVIVHLTDGLVEAHFHFFVVLAVVALYQEWTVFLLVIGFVLVHHAALTAVLPHSVFNHQAGQHAATGWALLHASLLLMAAAAHVVAWRSGERGLQDGLTGLATGGVLVRQLDKALARDRAAVVYLDLDGFKQVNDRLGHGAGDQLLAAAARRIEATVRSGDHVGRLGGDEFAVVLPGAGERTAARLAARLVEDLSRPFALPSGPASIGASVGVAAGRSTNRAEDVLHAADAAMYEAKRSGKGRWAAAAPAVARRPVTVSPALLPAAPPSPPQPPARPAAGALAAR